MKLYDDKLIILTGGAGFIGSCILRLLNELGMSNVVVVDQLGSSDKWRNLSNKKFLEYIDKKNLMTWLDVSDRASEIEAIIHMGACSSTVETNVDYLMENNYRYTLNLAEFALKNDIRFIYASSAATYGDGSRGFDDNHDTLEELQPMNPYGFSKHLFDLWAKNQGVLNQMTGLKFFNVYGPNEHHKGRMASVIYNLFPFVKKEGLIKLFKSNDPQNFKDGDQCRDFIYVKDAASLVVDILKKDIYGIFNVGSGEANTWNNVAKGMFSAIGAPPNIQYREMPEDLNAKYQNYTKASMDKLKKTLQYFNPTPIHEAISDYINNYITTNRIY
ncbi:MAG: ADP-L-glycero-D-manno-heptose-6-epimerase [Chlamydiae bacterium]|nr:ADP-L-glycero-D-manno-heptose-6-epimerase [Chlamydiota bacterium]